MILTINGGSSSIKAALYEADERLVADAQATGLGTSHSAFVTRRPNQTDADETLSDTTQDAAIARVMDWSREAGGNAQVDIVAHRIVHGGDVFDGPALIDDEILRRLETLIPLAPTHLPDELALVRRFMTALPRARHVACFDTAFHRTLPDVARTSSLPGTRRYGFHGLSYEYLRGELQRIDAAEARGRVVFAHLGHGASLAAVRDGQCLDTTMGMTPAGGLVMSTRSGDVDPGALAYLMRLHRWTADEMERTVTAASGLLAISGTTGDVRELLDRASTDNRAALAIAVFCASAAKGIASMAVATGGLDTLVFAAGIGERAAPIRADICRQLTWMGVQLDDEANASHRPVISSRTSAVTVRIIPTNETLIMARQARAWLQHGDRP